MIRVALDAMSGEKGIPVMLFGALKALREDLDLSIMLVGDPQILEPEIKKHAAEERLSVYPASQVIGMEEEPGQAFKAKKDASVSVALRLLAEGKVDAAISPGNTGASMVAATLTLGRLEGVRRPGLIMFMPRSGGYTGVLDVGAVVDGKPEDLALWALMGSQLYQEVMKIEKPKVGILSIGEEDIKGNLQTLEAFALLKKAPLNFIGNVEGHDIWNGCCDLMVCDGFVGNIVLKTCEGLAKMFFKEMKSSIKKGGLLVKLGALFCRPAFASMQKTLNADEYGGAILLGVNGNFIIAHGSANQTAIKNAILLGARCGRQQLIQKLNQKIRQYSEEHS